MIPIWLAVALAVAVGVACTAVTLLIKNATAGQSATPPATELEPVPSKATQIARDQRDAAAVEAVKNEPDPGAALEAALPPRKP